MTREQHKKLAELLHLFNTSEPATIKDLDHKQWRPFLTSLATDKDRSFALAAYFDQANYNLSLLANRLGQMERAEIEALRPELEAFVAIKEQFEART
jgi:hypothetical protein